jgi:uncharacterized protein YdeI (YjbR/CyaY-like superfamily)
MKRYKTVEGFIESQKQWKTELISLRQIINSTELVETVKWGTPVYTIGGKNVAGIGSFKSYFGIWFFQGVFLEDKHKKLINAQEGVTKGMRQWRMGSEDDIDRKMVLEYLEEAIQNQKDGKEIKPEKKRLVVPDELATTFVDKPEVKKAFDDFTMGKRREFAEYIREAKQEGTKQKRLLKVIPMILDGIGLNDKYK